MHQLYPHFLNGNKYITFATEIDEHMKGTEVSFFID